MPYASSAGFPQGRCRSMLVALRTGAALAATPAPLESKIETRRGCDPNRDSAFLVPPGAVTELALVGLRGDKARTGRISGLAGNQPPEPPDCRSMALDRLSGNFD